ncbi:superoxide dismutase [Spiroplasma sabaudiense Ar-1343]|uniref:Superoxide dismutase n=1 Tax=Spiroplasma sabaudiense Ar-1343 TaxID=1276257 RepID=W6A8L2_9MOLU|nr:superoxide dismutase [Spiroplasma sabaudiense]AHI53508.1 superoxide dismutase [Spiroplasma sabaudiense Ar-1343]
MFKRIELGEEIDFLEPVISKEQIDLHYNRHHLAYETVLNKVLSKYELPESIKTLEDLVRNYLSLPKELHVAVRQFGGGLINLNFYFKILKKDVKLTDGPLKEAILYNFKTVEGFCDEIARYALSIFGSGWTWLVIDRNENMRIYNTFNQDNPWFLGMTPIIGICVWEHAYTLDYLDNREEYVRNVLKNIDWEMVQKLYTNALK